MLLIILAIIGYLKGKSVSYNFIIAWNILFYHVWKMFIGILGNAGKDFTSNYWPFLLIALGLILIIKVASNRNKEFLLKQC